MGKKGFLNQKLGKRVTRKVQLLKSELSSATRSSYPVPPTSKSARKDPLPTQHGVATHGPTPKVK